VEKDSAVLQDSSRHIRLTCRAARAMAGFSLSLNRRYPSIFQSPVVFVGSGVG
jgi:hypothetical protein